MNLGVQLNSFDREEGPERFATRLAEIARASEEAGFDRIAVADHVWQHPIMAGPGANEPECYAMLAFLAANTECVGLGDGVGDPLPPPGDAGEGGDHARRALWRSRLIWGRPAFVSHLVTSLMMPCRGSTSRHSAITP